ncbi:hypothetical protein EV191_104111 [Tamaricihabitans halophyticus]|uniref:NAD(P)-dependent dehydrogenase (Short-subunit alcohol dehydrogenase family) n=1 Tax=Tamaricihabitans halophyticus TaxID=1262583 RepID=A0A4R2QWA3_9PSEU|nr:SDR family oxidoreductase [Tamaricihabitans halophyticus]TCP53544.1 hypothetical protein EV191_104111 [Tamaricihabitans halophyticus]
MVDDRMRDTVAIVFGGGTGATEYGISNGHAAAVSYAREGARVAVVDVDSAAATRTVERITDTGGAAIGVTADVTDEQNVAAAVERTLAEFGQIDVLHNNVGVTALGGPVELSYEQWQRTFAVNVDSVFLTCKYVLPGMLGRGRGAIVNVSSIAGLRHVGYEYPAYMASKAAVNQVTVSLAVSHAAQGIRANAVAPGFIDTPLVRQQLSSQADTVEDLLAARHALSPTGRMGSPWDVANACLFLASNEAAYVNGVCLPVDGGLTMRCG